MTRLLSQFLLLSLTTLALPSWALFGDNNTSNAFTPSGTNTFVPVDQAFPMNAYQQGDRVYIDWQVKPDYYLYQDRLNFSGENVTLGNIELQQGEPYTDEFFGDVTIYTQPLFVEVPLSQYQAGAKLIVQYQGCAKAGFCYPPETRVIDITPFSFDAVSDTTTDVQPAAATAADNSKPAESPQSATTGTNTSNSNNDLTDKLGQNWWTPALFLLLGIGLAFTPCVLPMYPILTSIVLGGGKRSHKQALLLSMVYVQGMALTYTLLGLVVASAGMQFQAAMQHPYVLIGLSVLFVALALSMFGLYTLQLPSNVQTWLNNLSNQQKGGNLLGVFAMGAISGLVCSPCTTAPLSGALLYVAQSGDLLTGGVALYALALGMGIPLIAAAVFGNKLLPKAGNWMERVKILFGFVLLAAPIFLLERLLPEFWSSVLWSGLGIAAFSWLYHQKNALPFGGWKQSCVGIIAILGLFASAQPLLNHWLGAPTSNESEISVSFTRVNNLAELNAELDKAKLAGKPVMLDFYADWCVACKEFEKYTFHDANVEPVLANFVLLQADVTRNQVQDIEMLKAMDVLGLPTIEFWDANGTQLPSARLTGFVGAEDFLEHLNQYTLLNE
ncbi:protein-disulfide reductase DsbD [Vibrio maritimus]